MENGDKKHYLEIVTNGNKESIPLKGIKIPPDTGEDRFLHLLSNFAQA